MKYSNLIADMIAEGATPEMILVAVRAIERQEDGALERRRAADRARQERHRLSRDITLGNVSHAPSRSRVRVEDKTLTTQIEPQDQKPSRTQGDVAEFRAGLSPDVPEEVLSEFVKVRRKKRGALTGYAAKLFREDAAKCGMTVADAAKECVRSSWITVKPEYFAGRARAGPAQRPMNPTLAAALRLKDEFDAVSPSEIEGNHSAPRLVAIGGSSG